MDFEILKSENAFDKIRVDSTKLLETLDYLKNTPEYDFDRLNAIIAIDLIDKFELIYDLLSVKSNKRGRISVLVDRNSPHITSIVSIYKSAYFDECEIFDMFGIIFDNNPNLKRLLMPKSWVGYPLRKDYEQDDERLSWNK